MKKFLKFMNRLISNFWVQLLFLTGCMVGIFALGGAFTSPSSAGEKILELITSVDILSIFLAAAVSLIVANIILKTKRLLEESLKLEDDHHKIVCYYDKHPDYTVPDALFCDKDGVKMYLDNVVPKRKKPKNPNSDRYGDKYKVRQKDIDAYVNGGKLYLPGVCVFANITGGAEIVFDDRKNMFELPRFITENALALMEAHKNSSVRNNDTIRLDDISFSGNKLVLHTSRTQYYDMLVTNRCMDFKLNNTVSVREMYEYGSHVSPLSSSPLANQIGINGLIVTRDGYLLTEKRGHSKTTWKNKFAQPISLAMKKSDVILNNGLMGGTHADANATFEKIIMTTVKKNFGLVKSDFIGFDIAYNLLGIARDLLEGGKPNIYFYVMTKYTAKELKTVLERKCKKYAQSIDDPSVADEPLPAISADKLDSDFYLISHKDIALDYEYALKVKTRKIYRIKREFYPRVGRLASKTVESGYKIARAFNRSIKRECGDALLACLYFSNLCAKRITSEMNSTKQLLEASNE